MNQMFVDGKAPFHRLARIIRFGYLEVFPLEQSLNIRFEEAGINV